MALTGRLFCFGHTRTNPHAASKPRLAAIVSPTLEGMGYELVRVAVLGRERPTVQVMADRADGGQITVADCEAISHALGAVLDVEDPIPGSLVAGNQLRRHRPPADARQGLEPLSPATSRAPKPSCRSMAAGASPASCWAPTTRPPASGSTTAAKSRFP